MYRLINILLVTALLPMLLVHAPLYAQQPDFSRVEIKIHKVRGNVYMLEGLGGNIGLFTGADGAFLIDDQFAPLTGKIVAAVRTDTVSGEYPHPR